MTILPHPEAQTADGGSVVRWPVEQSTPCLRCVFPDTPEEDDASTSRTIGVFAPVVTMIAAHQAAEAIKLLTGNLDAVDRRLLSIDAWSGRIRRLDISGARPASRCLCCGEGDFEHLRCSEG